MANGHKARIEARIAELQQRLREIDDTLDAPIDRDLEDQAIELETTEVLEGIGNAGLKELRLLEAALERVEDGSYGICAKCGDDISEARLEAVPFAQLCRDCASGKPKR